MSSFNFTVDTREMARSMDGVSSQVGSVTMAVAAMQSAVIAAEAAAADRICKDVDRGFFSLIRSQVTQKISRLRSSVDSRLLELHDQGRALAGIKARMDRDYHMIATRYQRLFQSINDSLRTRVFELDKRASQLVNREISRIQIRARSLSAQGPLHQLESVQAAQVLAASQTKANAVRAIQAMHSFLAASGRQSRLLESMLVDGGAGPSVIRYVPLLLVETQSPIAGGGRWDICTARGTFKAVADTVETGARTAVFGLLPSLKWVGGDAGSQARVQTEFRRFADQAGLNDRVRDYTIRLAAGSPWQVLTGGGQ